MYKRFATFIAVIVLFCWLFSNWATAQTPVFYSLDETEAYIRERANQLSTSLTITLINREAYDMEESELWSELVQSAPNILYASFHLTRNSPGKMTINIQPTYRSGVRMADAWGTGDLSSLNDQEREVLREAQELVARLRAQCDTPLALEKAIYRELCARLTYTDRSSSSPDTPELSALTALTTGRVNCQGYSDAFYLLATLAGFEVGFQTGYNSENTTHVWNTICLDGQWYAVDVTAGDSASSDMADDCCYFLFNAGLDVAQTSLSWPERWETAQIAPRSDEHYFFLAQEAGFGFTCDSLDSAARLAFQKRRNEGRETVWIMLPSLAPNFKIDALHEALSDIVTQSGYAPASWHISYWTYESNLYLFIQWTSWGK